MTNLIYIDIRTILAGTDLHTLRQRHVQNRKHEKKLSAPNCGSRPKVLVDQILQDVEMFYLQGTLVSIAAVYSVRFDRLLAKSSTTAKHPLTRVFCSYWSKTLKLSYFWLCFFLTPALLLVTWNRPQGYGWVDSRMCARMWGGGVVGGKEGDCWGVFGVRWCFGV